MGIKDRKLHETRGVCVCSTLGKLPDSRTEPISQLPLIHRAAVGDINKPIKASKGVEVSCPEFPRGALLPEMLLLLSDHQYGTPAVR